MQRAVNEAHARVVELRARFGPPTVQPWTQAQTAAHETAWRAWRDLERDLQAAVTDHAGTEGVRRTEVEKAVRERASESDGPD
ncbi:hypothetical protein ABZ252_29360 [Streptomyces sp. NPDC006175]|uniref:hypothetical protein n=1 Tax=Streptomyces sp. NPDC006175 TaxID=3154471 RepID=UPI0033A3CA89